MNATQHESSSNLQTEVHQRANVFNIPRTNPMNEKIKVIVTINKGNVTAVLSGIPLDVVIVDYDNIEAGDTAPDRLTFEDGTNAAEFMKATATQDQY